MPSPLNLDTWVWPPGPNTKRPLLTQGQEVRIYLRATAEDGAPASPTGVRLELRRPDATIQVIDGVDIQAGEEAGTFFVAVQLDQNRGWRYEWIHTGPVEGHIAGAINVQSGTVQPPGPGNPVLTTEDLDPLATEGGGILRVKRIGALPSAATPAGLKLVGTQGGESKNIGADDLVVLAADGAAQQLNLDVDGKIDRAGDAMTGDLGLAGTPSSDGAAAPKGYVNFRTGIHSFPTYAPFAAAAAAGTIAPGTRAVMLAGRFVEGDTWRTSYVRVPAATVAAYGLSAGALALLTVPDASGDYWVLDATQITPRMLGHNGDVVWGPPSAGTGTSLGAVLTAINECALHVKTTGVLLRLESRYLLADGAPWGPETGVAVEATRWAGGVAGGGETRAISPAIVVDPLDGSGNVVRWLKAPRPGGRMWGFGILNARPFTGAAQAVSDDAFRQLDLFCGVGLVVGKGAGLDPAYVPADVISMLAADPAAGSDQVADVCNVELPCILGFRVGLIGNFVSAARVYVNQIDSIIPAILGNIGAKARFRGWTAKGWTSANLAGSFATVAVTGAARTAEGYLEVTLAKRAPYGCTAGTVIADFRDAKAGINGLKINGSNTNAPSGSTVYVSDRSKLIFPAISPPVGAVFDVSSATATVRPGGTKRRNPILTLADNGTGGTRATLAYPIDLTNGDNGTTYRKVTIVAPNDQVNDTEVNGQPQIIDGTNVRWLIDVPNIYAKVIDATTIDLLTDDGAGGTMPLAWQPGTVLTAADLYILTAYRPGTTIIYNLDQSSRNEIFEWSHDGRSIASGGLREIDCGIGGEGDSLISTKFGVDILPGSNDYLLAFSEITRPGAFAVRANQGGNGWAAIIGCYANFGLTKTLIAGPGSGILSVGNRWKASATATNMQIHVDSDSLGVGLFAGEVDGAIYVTSDTPEGQRLVTGVYPDPDMPGRLKALGGNGFLFSVIKPGATGDDPGTELPILTINGDGQADQFQLRGLSAGEISALTKGGTIYRRSADGLLYLIPADNVPGVKLLTVAANEFTSVATTASAAPVTLTYDGAAPSNANQYRLTTNATSVVLDLVVKAQRTDGVNATQGDSATWIVKLFLSRANNAASLDLQGGGPALAPTYARGNGAAWRLALTADATNAVLQQVITTADGMTVAANSALKVAA